MKGYPIACGYIGYLPSENAYRLFDTEEEYKMVYREEEGSEET